MKSRNSMQLGNIREEELQAQCLEAGCLYFMFCPLMSLCHFLGLQLSTFPRGVSEMNAHQTQMLFPTSVACLDGKICDNSQKKVNSPVAMETSSRFFLFLFLLFAVNEWVLDPAGRQPRRRPSPAQPGKGQTLSKARSFLFAHSHQRTFFREQLFQEE